ncbi:hypothetical protein D3C87_2092950 [compost metagenome]
MVIWDSNHQLVHAIGQCFQPKGRRLLRDDADIRTPIRDGSYNCGTDALLDVELDIGVRFQERPDVQAQLLR